MPGEFDKYAKEYETLLCASIKHSGFPPAYFDEQKVREVHRRSGREFAGNINFLNFGCGIGKSEVFIRQYFPESLIHSADVSAESLKIAKERNKADTRITYHHFEVIEEFEPGVKFQIIFVANVFHHIPEDLHERTLRKLRQLLAPWGKLFVFEHNPVNPLTRQAFNTCEFDKGCSMIPSRKLKRLLRTAGFVKTEIAYTIFFPAMLRKLISLEKYMTKLPFGAQYYTMCSGS